jgi:hypothetical protein
VAYLAAVTEMDSQKAGAGNLANVYIWLHARAEYLRKLKAEKK